MTSRIITPATLSNKMFSPPAHLFCRRCLSVVIFCLSVLSLPAHAVFKAMTPEEFRTVLSDNTIVGLWAEREYRQFFSATGRTTYLERGGRPSQGSWRIDTQARYCSVWPPSPAEACYRVERDGERLQWHTSTGAIYPARVLPGEQLQW